MPFKDFTTEILTSADVDLYLMSQVIIRCTSGTRPSSPSQGWHIYETDTSRLMVYNGSTWIQQGGSRYVYKTADETVTTSTTRQQDDHLFVTLLANTRYAFELFLAHTGDINFAFSSPAGSTIYWGGDVIPTGTGSSAGSVYRLLAGSSPAVVTDISGGSFNAFFAPVKGVIATAGTAGDLRLMWAQPSASGSTVIKANSWMQVTPM